MDFIKGLPKSKGMNTILVVVDPLSKYAHFVAMRHPFTAQTVVVAFVKEVVKLHGIPRTITTDRDKVPSCREAPQTILKRTNRQR